MKKKIIIFFLFLLPLCFSAAAKSKVIRGIDSKLDEFIKVSIAITSTSDDVYVQPSFVVKIQKVKKCNIKQLQFDLSYFFGQKQEMIYHKEFILRLDSDEIKSLQEYGECEITVSMETVEKEKYYIENRIAELNEEIVSYVPVYFSVSY